MDGMSASLLAGLVTRLARVAPSCGAVRVVAVDGPSAAGKSVFASRLAVALGGVTVVGADDFPVPWDGDPLAWWPPLTAHVLTPLSEGRAGRFRPYDWRRAVYRDEIVVPPGPFLVIEGVGAARAGAPVAFRVWVDAAHDVRRWRAARRGDDLAVWDRWSARESAHFSADRTRERADLVIDGNAGENRDRTRPQPAR